MAGKVGRPRNADRYATQVESASDRLARALPDATEALIDLAMGRTFQERWVPAGLVTRKEVLRRPPREPSGFMDGDGNPVDAQGNPETPDDGIWLDPKDKPVTVDVLVYPHLPPNELVLVEQKPIPPCPKAIALIWERLAGKAVQAVEHSGEDGGPVQVVHFFLPENGRDGDRDQAPAGASDGIPGDVG